MASMIVTASNWIFSFIIIMVWPSMNNGMGMFGALIFFLCISFGAIIFSIFCIHEPKKDDSQDQKEESETNKNPIEEEEEEEDELEAL